MEENTKENIDESRREDTIAELIQEKKSIEDKMRMTKEKIESVKSKEPINFNELTDLQDEFDNLMQDRDNINSELASLGVRDNDAKFDIDDVEQEEQEKKAKQEQEQEKEREKEQEKEKEQRQEKESEKEQEAEKEQEEKAEKEQEEPEREEKEKEPENEEQEEEKEEQEPSPDKLTISEWEKKSGIRALSLGGLENKKYTEEEFRHEVLGQPGMVYLIQNPGSAEEFMRNNEEGWKSIMSSKSAIDMAIKNNNFPVDVNDESYILMPDNKKIEDRDNDGDIGKSDIYKQPKDIGESKDIDDEVSEDSVLKDIPEVEVNGRRAIKGKDVEAIINKGISVAVEGALVKSVVDEVGEGKVNEVLNGVGKGEFDKVSGEMGQDLSNPRAPEEPEKDKDDDFGEIKPPVV